MQGRGEDGSSAEERTQGQLLVPFKSEEDLDKTLLSGRQEKRSYRKLDFRSMWRRIF